MPLSRHDALSWTKNSQDTITLLVSRTDDLIPDGDRKMYLLRREIKQAWNWLKSPHTKNCRTFVKLNVPQTSINPKKTITLLDKCWRPYVGQLNFTGIQFSLCSLLSDSRFNSELETRYLSLKLSRGFNNILRYRLRSSTLAPSSFH